MKMLISLVLLLLVVFCAPTFAGENSADCFPGVVTSMIVDPLGASATAIEVSADVVCGVVEGFWIGASSLVVDPIGATLTAGEFVVDVGVLGCEIVYGAAEGVVAGAGHLIKDPIGATLTAGEAVANVPIAVASATLKFLFSSCKCV